MAPDLGIGLLGGIIYQEAIDEILVERDLLSLLGLLVLPAGLEDVLPLGQEVLDLHGEMHGPVPADIAAILQGFWPLWLVFIEAPALDLSEEGFLEFLLLMRLDRRRLHAQLPGILSGDGQLILEDVIVLPHHHHVLLQDVFLVLERADLPLVLDLLDLHLVNLDAHSQLISGAGLLLWAVDRDAADSLNLELGMNLFRLEDLHLSPEILDLLLHLCFGDLLASWTIVLDIILDLLVVLTRGAS